ncbi:MAG: tRNA (adenosine(37)-N6)-dimethylallyltransferase MiaA [Rhodocyclaceae bacterium]|nr:tRNA (adenosine(37)-N6)-dimethylallyltransferase MiaA [Rhodocyclaceae bacterium]
MADKQLPPAILLLGPTASGKTDLALRLAEQHPIDLISVDSALVFKDMNIGTAKPDAETLHRYPHALVNIITPEEIYSAARFREDALAAMADSTARDRIPLLVGGTMLYVKALLEGLSDLPQADAALRADLDARARAQGWPSMHAELAKLDPVTAIRLAPNDSQRIQRALEICLISGRPASALYAEQAQQETPPYRFLSLALLPSDRAWLHERIALRFKFMLQQGFVEEVEALRAKYTLHTDLPSMRCVGYRQAWEMLEGTLPADELEERGIYATRQLAKRQITWLTNSIDCEAFDCLQKNNADLIGRRVAEFLSV